MMGSGLGHFLVPIQSSYYHFKALLTTYEVFSPNQGRMTHELFDFNCNIMGTPFFTEVKVYANNVEKATKCLKDKMDREDLRMEGNNFTEYQKKALEDVCRLIFKEFSNTAGVAFLKLDCDCIKLAGVSSTGDQTSPMMLVSGNSPVIDESTGEETTPVCEKCKDDSLGVFRTKNRGIIWNNKKAVLSKQIRNKIKAKVFDSDLY